MEGLRKALDNLMGKNRNLPLHEQLIKKKHFDDPDVCGIITQKGTCIILNDRTGELFLKSPTRMAIQAEGEEGVIINAEHIYLSSLDQVQVNKGDQGVIFINELTEKLNKLVKEVSNLNAQDDRICSFHCTRQSRIARNSMRQFQDFH